MIYRSSKRFKFNKEKGMNAKEVKDYAKSKGADLIGIAPMERLAYLPAENNPISIFPEVKSVIVVGRRILRGALRGIEEGTNFGSTYHCFGAHYLEGQFLSKTVYDITSFLESNGIESVPMKGYRQKDEITYNRSQENTTRFVARNGGRPRTEQFLQPFRFILS